MKEINQRYGEVYKNYLQGMLEFDPNVRIHINELSSSLEHSEYFVISTNSGPKTSFSELFEFYRKSYQIETGKPIQRTIARAMPLSRALLQANLFDRKKVFLELLDLKTH